MHEHATRPATACEGCRRSGCAEKTTENPERISRWPIGRIPLRFPAQEPSGRLTRCALLLIPGALAPAALQVISMRSLGLLSRSSSALIEDDLLPLQTVLLVGLAGFLLNRTAGPGTAGRNARAAVQQERLRIARDLHDLLGYSLSIIALKGELVHGLITSDTARARGEAAELLMVCRQALADTRAVSLGYRHLSLAAEAELAAESLRSAGVQTRSSVARCRLHPLVDTTLAAVLREGINNVLRHSEAQRCEISAVVVADRVRLTLSNDGVSGPLPPHLPAGHGGSGLANMRARLDAVGGQVRVEVRDGVFRLLVEAPTRLRSGAAGPPAGGHRHDMTRA